MFEMTGERYKISGHKLPLVKDFLIKTTGASLDNTMPSQNEMQLSKIPKPIMNHEFFNDLKSLVDITYSEDPQDRLFRAHGTTDIRLLISLTGDETRHDTKVSV
jgi:alkyldihydroxyacetonephosphate synthase